MNKKNMSFTTKISSLLLLGVTIGLGIFLLFGKLFVIKENLDGDNYDINEDTSLQVSYEPEKKKKGSQDDQPDLDVDIFNSNIV